MNAIKIALAIMCLGVSGVTYGLRDHHTAALCLKLLKIQQQEQVNQRIKQAIITQRKRMAKHHNNTRGTGKKRPFGEKRTHRRPSRSTKV